MDKGVSRGLFLQVVWILSILHQSNNGVQAVMRGPPRIHTNELKTLQVARLGQEFRLVCPVESDPSPIVDWFKDGEDITSAWSRFGFKQTSRTLRIRPVHLDDSGIYKCKGVNGFGSQSVKMRVVVMEDSMTPEMNGDAKPYDSSGSRNQRLELSKLSPTPSAPTLTPETLEQSTNPFSLLPGNSIQIGCEAKGVPTPKVTWVKDGVPVGEKMWKLSSWKLVLSKLEFEDTGTYECVARNSMGKASTLIRLHIAELVEKQRPSLASDFPANVTVLTGNEAMLKCVVRSGFTTMPPHIKWLKRVPSEEALEMNRHNNPRLLPADHTHVLVIQETHEDRIRINETSEDGTFVSKLSISRTEEGDEGTYICLATNSQGYTFKEAKLSVIGGGDMATTPTLPLPLIVIGLSILAGLILVGSAQFLRKYQERNQKQVKQAASRLKMATTGTTNLQLNPHHPPDHRCEQRQLLSTTAHSSSSSSDQGSRRSGESSHFQNHFHHHHCSIPVKYAMVRCSCTGHGQPYPPHVSSQLKGQSDKCYNDSFMGSTSHSLHFGHWT